MKSAYIKQLILFIATAFLTLHVSAQAQGINYQGVARNQGGAPYVNQTINVRLSILSGSPSGTVEYMEVRNITTNQFGLFVIQIGSSGAVSATGAFDGIDWSVGRKILKNRDRIARAGKLY